MTPSFKKHTVELDPEKVALFKEKFPGSSLKWFFDSCLSAFSRKIEDKKIVPQLDSIFDEAVTEAIDNLHEGGYTRETEQ